MSLTVLHVAYALAPVKADVAGGPSKYSVGWIKHWCAQASVPSSSRAKIHLSPAN